MNKIFIYFFSSFLMLFSLAGQGQIKDEYTSWTELTGDIFGATYRLFDVCFVNPDTGFVVGGIIRRHLDWGEVLMTEDAGNTWRATYNADQTKDHLCPVFCHFFNNSKGYFSCRGGAIYRTLDGGISWVRDSIVGFRDISSINDTLSWALGEGINLYVTWDGGEIWDHYIDRADGCPGEGSCAYNSIFFLDKDRGYGVGWGGLIMKFSFPETRNISCETSAPLNKVFFSNQNIGWVAGGYNSTDDFQPVFLRTEDGGDNWTEIAGLDYLIHDFYFEDTIHGWAVGDNYLGDGCMLETYDGGFTWELTGQYPEGGLNALYMKEGVGWAIGDNGLIFKTGYASATGMDLDYPVKERDENLFRNYPNPFHSHTVISYQLSVASDVELSIYNLSGRKIATPVNKTQPSGKQQVVWNAADMQPGVYFCELKSAQGSQVIKMILID